MVSTTNSVGGLRYTETASSASRSRRDYAAQTGDATSRGAFKRELNRTTGTDTRASRTGAASNQSQVSGTTASTSQKTDTPAQNGWSIFTSKTPYMHPAPAQSTSAASQNAAPETAAPVAAKSDADIVQSLKDALTAAGIGHEGLGLEAHNDVVGYVTGSYLNRYISVSVNGRSEGLMTDIVANNPGVAVGDIKRMLSTG